MKDILLKPFEAILFVYAALIFILLYIQIVLCPTLLLPLTLSLLMAFTPVPESIEIVIASAAIGFLAGCIWAEKIRKGMGIVTFHGYLLSTPEIEGWRTANISNHSTH